MVGTFLSEDRDSLQKISVTTTKWNLKRFQRLHGKSEYSGTGIGLGIVEKIVNNRHGFIKAAGKVGKGVTFTIWLPE